MLREFRSLSIRGRYFHRIGFVSIKPTYEKTYSLNPGDSSLRHGSIVLRDPGHHDYDDTDGVSRHTHPDHHEHYRNAPKYGRLLTWESNLFRERKERFARADRVEFSFAPPALGRGFSFLFNCLTNDLCDRL